MSCLSIVWYDPGHGGGLFTMSELLLRIERQMARLSSFFLSLAVFHA